MSCLDDVGMERVLLGLASDDERTHSGSCEACRRRLLELDAQGQDFRRFVFPATLDEVVAQHQGRRRRRWLMVPALAAMVGVALVWRGPPPDDYLGVKGGSLGLSVYTVDDSGAAVRLEDGARVTPAAALRFRVRPSQPCYLWLLSVDNGGLVSRLYPATGEAPLIASETTLPGGATLDGVAGLERVLGVCTLEPTSYQAVAEVTRQRVVPDVRGSSSVPLGGPQGSLLLEKSE